MKLPLFLTICISIWYDIYMAYEHTVPFPIAYLSHVILCIYTSYKCLIYLAYEHTVLFSCGLPSAKLSTVCSVIRAVDMATTAPMDRDTRDTLRYFLIR